MVAVGLPSLFFLLAATPSHAGFFRGPSSAPVAAPGAAPAAPATPTLSPSENLARATKGLQADGAPEQGLHGDLVKHEDKKTTTQDWRLEYGAGTQSLKQICDKNKSNVWCRQHAHQIALLALNGPSSAPAAARGAAPGAAPAVPAVPTLSPAENLARATKGLQADGSPEQGLHGELVKHENQKTTTQDWRSEYGTSSKSLKQICDENKSSVWCVQHKHQFAGLSFNGPSSGPAAAPGAEPAAPATPTLSPSDNLARAAKGLQSDAAPEQGLQGDLVKHEDKKTSLQDWRSEYGAGTKSLQQICNENKNSVWCRQHAQAIASR